MSCRLLLWSYTLFLKSLSLLLGSYRLCFWSCRLLLSTHGILPRSHRLECFLELYFAIGPTCQKHVCEGVNLDTLVYVNNCQSRLCKAILTGFGCFATFYDFMWAVTINSKWGKFDKRTYFTGYVWPYASYHTVVDALSFFLPLVYILIIWYFCQETGVYRRLNWPFNAINFRFVYI